MGIWWDTIWVLQVMLIPLEWWGNDDVSAVESNPKIRNKYSSIILGIPLYVDYWMLYILKYHALWFYELTDIYTYPHEKWSGAWMLLILPTRSWWRKQNITTFDSSSSTQHVFRVPNVGPVDPVPCRDPRRKIRAHHGFRSRIRESSNRGSPGCC